MHPDDYQRLRDLARRHALQLRQEAIRDAQAALARGFLRVVRRVFHPARAGAAQPHSFTPELKTPCPPSF